MPSLRFVAILALLAASSVSGAAVLKRQTSSNPGQQGTSVNVYNGDTISGLWVSVCCLQPVLISILARAIDDAVFKRQTGPQNGGQGVSANVQIDANADVRDSIGGAYLSVYCL